MITLDFWRQFSILEHFFSFLKYLSPAIRGVKFDPIPPRNMPKIARLIIPRTRKTEK